MAIDLFRVRFQQTWGDQFGDFLDDVVTANELEETLRGYAAKWFPDGYDMTQNPNSPAAWGVNELTGTKRTLLFFVENIGGIDS